MLDSRMKVMDAACHFEMPVFHHKVLKEAGYIELRTRTVDSPCFLF